MEFQEHVVIIRIVRYFEIENPTVVIVADALDFVPNEKISEANMKNHPFLKKLGASPNSLVNSCVKWLGLP